MFSDPHAIVPQLAIAPGSSVADLGAGTGAYSFVLADAVGSEGKVYACEIQKDMLARLDNEIRERHVGNIQTIWSNIENRQGTRLRDQSIDWVIAANILFQVEDRPEFAGEVARILKPGGAVLVVDWSESFGNLGPHQNQVVSREEAAHLFESAGFRLAPQVVDAGSHHYGIILRK